MDRKTPSYKAVALIEYKNIRKVFQNVVAERFK